MNESFAHLRRRRRGDHIGFDRLAEKLEAYARAHPADLEAVTRLAGFLSYLEPDEQAAMDDALAQSFPASDPPAHSTPLST